MNLNYLQNSAYLFNNQQNLNIHYLTVSAWELLGAAQQDLKQDLNSSSIKTRDTDAR